MFSDNPVSLVRYGSMLATSQSFRVFCGVDALAEMAGIPEPGSFRRCHTIVRPVCERFVVSDSQGRLQLTGYRRVRRYAIGESAVSDCLLTSASLPAEYAGQAICRNGRYDSVSVIAAGAGLAARPPHRSPQAS